jgi:general secretion pathway protein E
LDGQLSAAEILGLARSGALVLLGPVLAVAGCLAAGLRARSRAVLRSAVAAFIVVSLTYVILLNIPRFRPGGGGDTDWLILRELAYFGGGAAVLFALVWWKDLFQVGAGGDASGVRGLVDELLAKALSVRASDVHLEPGAEGGAVRYRIDGILHTVATSPRDLLDRAVSRLKVMGRMDIAQKRLPQDGHATLRLPDRRLQLRISTVPSRFGERAVVRLLDPQTGLLGLGGLGLKPEPEQAVSRIAARGHGTFFAVGPTGCGKTTTLYAALLQVDSAERNVVTIEDPVEYVLPGITQLPVRRKQAMTFASGLRSVLRQDIDVVMVGEVRDNETAETVMEAAQTGHLVFSTLHTNDAPSAVTRLLDLGVEPYQLASSLTAVVAQRLVRRICPRCKEEYGVTEEEQDEFGEELAGAETLHRGRGCPGCMGTGYYGRTGLFELLLVNEAVRDAIMDSPSAGAIREMALQHGMTTIRADGVQKALAGVTTLEEVSRATEAEQ